MSAPQSLLQATVNRLSARLQSGIGDVLATLASLAEAAPERLQQEWTLFVEEVEQEAERLERRENPEATPAASPGSSPPSSASGAEAASTGFAGAGTAAPGSPPSTQEQIDALRARVAGLSGRLEERP
ncbi:hypothetical protein [Cyanobium sp. Morenito 9A2]|uniref:hypothetical protein n=1 Tax=Cyanobium sp. Morenito 9A2 TaxID=2823718 RepID=UPI0020CE06C4|nr:hypothetical protein [Cyanobium sp. Morenito 9A2]MCP9850034.1 hypothetical protein [Cyanobium sp. Morenito 9A2]